MNRFGRIVLALFVSSAAFPSSADEFDSKTLFRKGAWAVELTHNTSNGRLWCTARTDNNFGQTFSLTAYQNSQLTLFVFDNSWNIASRPLRFFVDVDYSRWTMDGQGDNISVSLTMNDPKTAVDFLEDLMAGNAVSVSNANEQKLAVFSLSGSYAAITNLFSCWESIDNSDPFTSNADPFTGASDPF